MCKSQQIYTSSQKVKTEHPFDTFRRHRIFSLPESFCVWSDGPSCSPLQSLARVFAGMSDGLVAVYSLLEDLPVEGETYLCSHTFNKTVFTLKDSDPRQKPYPVRSMALVSSGSQVSRNISSLSHMRVFTF